MSNVSPIDGHHFSHAPCVGATSSGSGVVAPQRIPRRELVARVTTFLRDNLGEPVTVADLSRMAGVSERTLRAAFHDVIGVSPKRYAITERLQAAHQALQRADPQSTTVTDVAMTFGFFELGRFAGRYRHTFGEVPSRTLRQAVADSERAA
jgi:AraC family transcriptional regulator, ethanolamine operon transcriptional activator